MPRPTFARIDLDAVMHNVRAVKQLVGGRKVCASVKADAYGHGAPLTARMMSEAGVDMFGVAMTEEAIELRQCGIREPIVLLTTVPESDIDELLDHRVTACIVGEGFARKLSERAVRRGLTAEAHVNVDTGMRRVGIFHDEAAEAILRIARLPALKITGILSHFACCGEEDQGVSVRQLARFRRVISALEGGGMQLPMLHMANSGAVMQMPESYLDCVRPGLILYGMYPLDFLSLMSRRIRLKPVMSLQTRISCCNRVASGEKLGYGHTFTTWRESVIATLPIGYHDGFLSQYSNLGQVLVRGRRAAVVGRVCMDQTLIDVTDIPGVREGDEVIIYGDQQGRRISVEEMAGLLGRVPYELTCSVGGRVRRRYVLNGAIAGETPMRSLVPPELVEDILSSTRAATEDQSAAAAGRRGVA